MQVALHKKRVKTMQEVDKKIYTAFLQLVKTQKKITVSSVAKCANIERPSVYYRLNKLIS